MVNVIVSLLGNPAVQTLLISGVLWLVHKATKNSANAARWNAISSIALNTAVDMYQNYGKPGFQTWQEIAVRTMEEVIKEVAANPGLKNLTADEQGKLGPLINTLVQRKNGIAITAKN